VWKIIINSAYGFWGLRVEDKDSVLIQEKGARAIYTTTSTEASF